MALYGYCCWVHNIFSMIVTDLGYLALFYVQVTLYKYNMPFKESRMYIALM